MKKTINRINTKLLFVTIIVIGFFLRFYLLGVNPPSLDWDEASIGYNAYSILKTGKDEYGNFMPLSFRSFDDYKPPVYVYLTVPSVALFGLTEFAVRFPAAVIGVFCVGIMYFFTKELFKPGMRGEYIALLSAFFMAVSPWHLQFSRAAFEGNVGLFFLILALFLFFRGIKKPFYFLLFAFSFVLSMYSYHSFRLLNPILLIVLILFFNKELLVKKAYSAFSLLVIILLSLPIYLSFINPTGTGARLSMVTVFQDDKTLKISAEKTLIAKEKHDLVGQVIYNRRFIFIPQIIEGYIDHFNFDFLFIRGDGGVQHHAYNMGMLYLWDEPFIIIGLIYLLRRKLNPRIGVLILLFFLAPLPASITTGTPHPVRAIAMVPAFHIFAASGFIYCFYKFRKRYVGKLLLTSIALLFFVNIIYYLHTYYVLTPIKYGYFWQYGNKQAIQSAALVDKSVKRVIMSYEYDQPYIYYLFYNRVDPSYYQKIWNYSKTGSVDRFYRKIGKYEFRPINFTEDSKLPNTLLIGTPDEIKVEVNSNIYFPDGKIAYKLIRTP